LNEGYRLFGAAIAALGEELDWARLGASYCEGDGSTFFDEELCARVFDRGFEIADTIASQLPQNGPRRSLYLGAAVAELAPILAEHFVLGREVCWLNLPGDETRELPRALALVGTQLGQALPSPNTDAITTCEPSAFDHLWMVSVLTDPDAFPALHDHLYERVGGLLATGRGDLSAERLRAEELVEHWLDRAAKTALLTTTEEERLLIEPAVHRRGGEWSVFDATHETAIVGDMLRLCRWSR